MEVMSFDEIITSLQKKRRTTSLLMGNGFSMAYDVEIFSYNALHNFLQSQEDELLTKLFGAIQTRNFELVTYSDADAKHIESILPKFQLKVQLFDAKTANVWGA